MPRAPMTSLYSVSGASGGAALDLTPPATPAPVSLASGTTSLGSTSIGSWSAAVTVTATVSASAGGAVTATVTGSGAGPYSVSIASGLADGRTYSVRLRGTGADGQVADVVLAVAVQTPASVTGSIAWVLAADYDYTQVVTSSRVVTSGTVSSGVVGLPDMTLAADSGTTFGVTPTNGTGLVLDSTGASTRGYVHFTPNWAALGISQLGWDGYAVEMQLSAPAYATAVFTSFLVGSVANSNGGTGQGAGARCINSAGTRTGTARSLAAGSPDLGATVFTSASDPANVAFLGGFASGEQGQGILNGALPAGGPDGYTIYRDGNGRTIGTAATYSPGIVSLLWGNGVFSGAISRVRIWRRGVV